jgi:hypothetical protein
MMPVRGLFGAALLAISCIALAELQLTAVQAKSHVGVGVWAKWSIEATNFAGQTTYSEVINVNSGDLGCNPP